MFWTKILHDAYSLARLQETTNSALSSTARGQNNRYTSNFSRIPPLSSTTGLPLLPTPLHGGQLFGVGEGNSRPTKTLTSKEIDMKRVKGEFFCVWKSLSQLMYARISSCSLLR